MRCTQLSGLTDLADNFLSENRVISGTKEVIIRNVNGQILSQNISDILAEPEKVGEFWGMFPEQECYDLNKYCLRDGTYVEEYVQAEVWSSGPCIFLALRHSDTEEPLKDFLWSHNSIDSA